MGTTAALAITLGLLAAVNLWVHVGSRRWQLVTGPLATVGLLMVARAAGLSWAQLGLAAEDLITGLAYGGVAAAAIALVYAVAVAVPSTRGAFRDTRYQVGFPSALFLAIVTIPLTTVLFEEVAFRGVLWGLLDERRGAPVATALSSALFGLWHVLPALKMSRSNAAVAGGGGGGASRARTSLTVLGAVAFTVVAGVLFAELRRRSGSLAAPMVLHWAANGLGVLAAARVWALESGRAS